MLDELRLNALCEELIGNTRIALNSRFEYVESITIIRLVEFVVVVT